MFSRVEATELTLIIRLRAEEGEEGQEEGEEGEETSDGEEEEETGDDREVLVTRRKRDISSQHGECLAFPGLLFISFSKLCLILPLP